MVFITQRKVFPVYVYIYWQTLIITDKILDWLHEVSHLYNAELQYRNLKYYVESHQLESSKQSQYFQLKVTSKDNTTGAWLNASKLTLMAAYLMIHLRSKLS